MQEETLVPESTGTTLNRRLIVGVLVVGLALAYLLVTGLQENTAFYLEVDELLAQTPEVYDERVRMGARVVEGSLTADTENLVYTFDVTQGDLVVPVRYQGVVPDIFGDYSDQVLVIVEGALGQDGLFRADVLQAQCPSKMEARIAEAPETKPSP